MTFANVGNLGVKPGKRAEVQLRRQSRLLWVTVAGFILGALGGAAILHGEARPFAGAGSVIIPVALVAGIIAGASFVVSTRLHRPGETVPMFRWQALVSNISSAAVTIAIFSVTGLGVLLTGQILASGLQGLELSTLGGALLTGVAAAVGARAAFRAGTDLSPGALAGVGLLPLDRAPVPHLISAFSAVALLVLASTLSTFELPETPRLLRGVTVGFVVLVAVIVLVSFPLHLPMTAVEGIVMGLALLWLTTFVRVLDVLCPGTSLPSTSRHPLGK
ncbi:MAG: hypothetical protein ACTIJ6_02940 [Leucobacter sp.]